MSFLCVPIPRLETIRKFFTKYPAIYTFLIIEQYKLESKTSVTLESLVFIANMAEVIKTKLFNVTFCN